MSDLKGEIIASALAAHIPPMELDHKAALELLYQQQIREMADTDFEALVRHYRECRRQDAAKRLTRERTRAANAAKKADLDARRKAKAKPTPPDQASPQGGGEGGAA